MGMDLHGAGGTERLSIAAWGQLLDLASEYGWQAVGTEMNEESFRRYLEFVAGVPKDELDSKYALALLEWDGNYWHNSDQIVTDADARGLAEALTRALEELPPDKLLDAYEVTIPLFEVGPEPDEKVLQILKALPSMSIKDGVLVAVGLTDGAAYEAKPTHYWSGHTERIRQFITFFEAGSFMIG